jgi:hypothetical protein
LAAELIGDTGAYGTIAEHIADLETGSTWTEDMIGQLQAQEHAGDVQINRNAPQGGFWLIYEPAVGAEHNAQHHDLSGLGNARVVSSAASPTWEVYDPLVWLRGFENEGPGNNAVAAIASNFVSAGEEQRFSHLLCINKGLSSSNANYGILMSDADCLAKVYRCGFIGFGSAGLAPAGGYAGSALIHNTVHRCNTGNDAFRGGIATSSANFAIEANLCIGNLNLDIRNANGTLDYNYTSDTTGDAEGANGVANITTADQIIAPYVSDWDTVDIRSKNGATGQGMSPGYSTTTYPLIDRPLSDFRGSAISGSWDIGADQYSAGGGGPTTHEVPLTAAVGASPSLSGSSQFGRSLTASAGASPSLSGTSQFTRSLPATAGASPS